MITADRPAGSRMHFNKRSIFNNSVHSFDQLREWTDSPAPRNHARAVEAAVRLAAYRYGAGEVDKPRWAITMLLHDADYDRWPSMHPHSIQYI